MKLHIVVALSILFLVSQVNAQEKLVLKDQKDKISYIVGENQLCISEKCWLVIEEFFYLVFMQKDLLFKFTSGMQAGK